MANDVFNIAKGRVNQYFDNVEQNDPAGCEIQVKLLKVAEVDATLEDYATFSALLAGSNSEADFTNYGGGKSLTATGLSITTDNTGNTQYCSIDPNLTWSSAGGTTDNTLVKLVVCYDPLGTDVDTNLIPLTHHDFSATTNGSDLTADFTTSGKVFEAS